MQIENAKNAAEMLRQAAELARKAAEMSEQGAPDKTIEELRQSAGRLADQAAGMLAETKDAPTQQKPSVKYRLLGAALTAGAALYLMPELRQEIAFEVERVSKGWRKVK